MSDFLRTSATKEPFASGRQSGRKVYAINSRALAMADVFIETETDPFVESCASKMVTSYPLAEPAA